MSQLSQTIGWPASILGLGEHRPATVLANDQLAARLDTTDEWIRTRTGIEQRGIAAPDETVASMAVDASQKALADAGVDPEQVGLVVLASCTLPDQIPGDAAAVASGIGAGAAGALDLNAACAGFCYALSLATDAVRLGRVSYAVVAAAERLSDVLDWSDRASAILFGDGAAAIVVGRSERPGIGPVVWGSDGAAADLIRTTPAGHITMDGPAVYRWATTAMPTVARQICAAADVSPAELAAVIPHQANLRIIHAIAAGLDTGRPDAAGLVVADDIVTAGNTSSASIPLAMAALRSRSAIGSGDLALLLGFGAGLTWAGCVVAMP